MEIALAHPGHHRPPDASSGFIVTPSLADPRQLLLLYEGRPLPEGTGSSHLVLEILFSQTC